ncbi:RNA 2',3'-cyclic phosphodiesterase [Candidatus Peregrinibacteria bacterium]|nr:RNA 2',3'-cyclic phosphodiesterase [Candidatus Peregrinibacteria bacterium]
MRLFIAIDLPGNIKEYLKKIQSLLPDAKMSNRLCPAKRGKAKQLMPRQGGATLTHDFHLTLKFLGSCDEKLRAKVENELKVASASFKPFESQLTDIGTFGGRIPRVIWVGISSPDWLKDFARGIENRVAKFGFEKENRFTPHITLARVKEITRPENFLKELGKIKLEPFKFKVRQFYLFESQLKPTGAIHVKLAVFP